MSAVPSLAKSMSHMIRALAWLRSAGSLKWALLIALTLAPLSASAHYCRFKRGDTKYLCLAKQEESLYFCRYVKNKDQQRRCVAGFYGKKTYCGGIKDSEEKARCVADAEARAMKLEQRRLAQEAKNLSGQRAGQPPR